MRFKNNKKREKHLILAVNTDNSLYTDDTTIKFVIMTTDCHEIFTKEVSISHKLCKNIVCNTLKKHMFWIFVRIASMRQF